MKIIAFYLPQFHDIPENDQWWGKGFTEWVNIKKAKPLWEDHNQPVVPLNENYYNLLDDNVKIWQASLAKKYGVYGFCYYHYWFNGHMVLEKPMEQMLANKEIDLPFCICWANEPWTKQWIGQKDVLIPQYYGEKKEWKEHYDYLKQFFMDDRYIKEHNKPLMVIYRAEVIPNLEQMLSYWSELARVDGFGGIKFAYQDLRFDTLTGADDSPFDYDIEFQPDYACYDLCISKQPFWKKTAIWKFLRGKKRISQINYEKTHGVDIRQYRSYGKKKGTLTVADYDETWNAIIKRRPKSKKSVAGAFVSWDSTPRHEINGRFFKGFSIEKFQSYLSKQIKHVKQCYESDYVFMYAWNEWAEGGYLEPDEKFKYGKLEAIRNALNENNEFPTWDEQER